MRDVYHVTEDLLPSQILSVGFCGASFAPIFEWRAIATDYVPFGISPRIIPELSVWASERFGKEVGYPRLFFRLETAQEYIRRFTDHRSEMQLLGIALHQERLHQVYDLEQRR